jgi:DNA-binding MarR family transcriptional regulator
MGKRLELSDEEQIQINQAIFSLQNVYESRMKKENPNAENSPTIAEMGVLMVLGQVGEVNARTLSKMMDISAGTVSLYLSRLTERGLVEQNRSKDDKRTWTLGLTDSGKKAYQSTRLGTVRYTADIIACLTQAEQRTLHDLLLKLSHANGYEWQ